MPSLIGNKPNQVPTNGDLGTLAFQDASNPKVGAVVADSVTTTGNINLGQTSSALQSGGSGLTIFGASAAEVKFLNSTTGNTATDGTAFVTSGGNFVINNRESGFVSIGTSNTTRLSVTADGVLDLSIGQIKFPATQVASADANTLDDYEEGTFTPTAVGGTTAGTTTYTAQAGTYTKVGRMVTVNAVLDISNMTGTGNIVIGGLPFSVLTTSGTLACGSIIAGNLTLPASGSLVYVAGSGTTSGLLYVVSSATGYQTVAVDTSWSAYITITYQVV
jgi:hypothetical protein